MAIEFIEREYQLPLGNMGWSTQVPIFAADGTMVGGVDTGPYYKYDRLNDRWENMCKFARFHGRSPRVETGNHAGGAIAIQKNNSLNMVMLYDDWFWTSSNGGLDWYVKENMGQFDVNAFNGNSGVYRTRHVALAMDPDNKNIWYFGSPKTGVQWTTDDGLTKQTVPNGTIPFATGNGADGQPMAIVIDPSSPTVGTGGAVRHRRVLISHPTQGVYETIDGMGTIALTTGTPVGHHMMKITSAGVVWLSNVHATNMYRYVAGAWATITMPNANGWATFAIDPTNANKMTFIQDNGVAHTTQNALAGTPTFVARGALQRVAGPNEGDIHEWAEEDYFPLGNLEYHPLFPNAELWCGEGISPWMLNVAYDDTALIATSHTRSMEQGCGIDIYETATGVIIGIQDRKAIFATIADIRAERHPATHAIDEPIPALCHCRSLSVSPNGMVVATINQNALGGPAHNCAFNLQGGKPGFWTRFITLPPSGDPEADLSYYAGTIIAFDGGQRFQWYGGNIGAFETVDGTATWQAIPFGMTLGTQTGWGSFNIMRRRVGDTDKVTAGVSYAYNSGAADAGYQGFYRINANRSITRGWVGTVNTGGDFHRRMRMMPGYAGRGFLCSGQAGSEGANTSCHLYETADGWMSAPTSVLGGRVTEVIDVTYTAPEGGSAWPTIHFVGYLDGVRGEYKTTDKFATDPQIVRANALRLDGWVAEIGAMGANPLVRGRTFTAFTGNGGTMLERVAVRSGI